MQRQSVYAYQDLHVPTSSHASRLSGCLDEQATDPLSSILGGDQQCGDLGDRARSEQRPIPMKDHQPAGRSPLESHQGSS